MKQRALLLILDGIGFHPGREAAILDETWEALNAETRARLDASIDACAPLARLAAALVEGGTFDGTPGRTVARRLLTTPTLVTQSHDLLAVGALADADLPAIRRERAKLADARVAGRGIDDLVHAPRAQAAYKHHYIPWCIKTPTIWRLREENPTFVVHPYGIYAGYPDIAPKPAIMGNSDTGHQQIMNLCVAKQISTTITDKFQTGEMNHMPAINERLRAAGTEPGRKIVARFMCSGEFGDDGFVHSCFPHFEGFLRLYFEELKLPVERLSLQFILDGRDSPGDSSIVARQADGLDRGNFLGKLRAMLDRHGAAGCVHWIMGRQFMDRDYKGAMIRADYELIVRNKGRRVADFDAALAQIAADHAAGLSDAQVEPIVVGDPSPVDGRTVYFNLQFRADRQEPITACLLGRKDFIMKQAEEKKKVPTWDNCDWFADLSGIHVFTLAEYNSKFTGRDCTPIATDAPQEHNLLWLLHEAAPDFRFFFLGEGVKEKHVGMFSRGRRSQPLAPNEDRFIVPSYGKEDGVANDNDFWKKPMMRHPEIGDKLVELLGERRHDFILVNVPGADMVGHLIVQHFDAGIETLESLEAFTKRSLEAARANGWSVIVTADHGNLEHYASDHGINDILTTVVQHEDSVGDLGRLTPALPGGETARLFDNSHTSLKLMGGEALLDGRVPPYPDIVLQSERRLVGRPLMTRLPAG